MTCLFATLTTIHRYEAVHCVETPVANRVRFRHTFAHLFTKTTQLKIGNARRRSHQLSYFPKKNPPAKEPGVQVCEIVAAIRLLALVATAVQNSASQSMADARHAA